MLTCLFTYKKDLLRHCGMAASFFTDISNRRHILKIQGVHAATMKEEKERSLTHQMMNVPFLYLITTPPWTSKEQTLYI